MDETTRAFIGSLMDGLIEKGDMVGVLEFIEDRLSLSSRRDFYLGYLVGALMESSVSARTFVPILKAIDYSKFSFDSKRSRITDEDKHKIRTMIVERLNLIQERVERELGR